MDHTCKLHSKFLKEYELRKCEGVECKNVIHPSSCKKLMTKFGEDDLEGPCLWKALLQAPKQGS